MFRDVSLLEREIKLVTADPLIDMLILMPHLDMARAAEPDQLDGLVNYLYDFSRDKSYGKPMVIVFQSFANDPWEGELRARLQTELPRKGVAVYSSLTGASHALARFFEYHRFQRELAAENQ